MGTEVEALKLAFSTSTYWLEWAYRAVFVGLLGNIAVILLFDLRDREKSWHEIALAGLASVVIAGGVWGESHFGQRATNAATQLQANLENKAALANERAANAYKRAAQADNDAAVANKQAARAYKLGAQTRLAEAKLRRENLLVKKQLTKSATRIAALTKRTDTAEAQIATAEKDAALANEKAEADRLARVKLEKVMSYRHLTSRQQRDITNSLRPFAGAKVDIFAYREEPDAFSLTIQLLTALGGEFVGPANVSLNEAALLPFRRTWWGGLKYDPKLLLERGFKYEAGAEWDVAAFTLDENFSQSGIRVCTLKDAKQKDRSAAAALVAALRAAGLEVTGPESGGCRANGKTRLFQGSGEPSAPIDLVIEFRPILSGQAAK